MLQESHGETVHETTEAVHGAAEAAHGAAGHADGAVDPGGEILHHILDSHELESPWGGGAIPLPEIHLPEALGGFEIEIPWVGSIHVPQIHLPEALGGFDLSITKHVVMMWIAGAILLAMFSLAARTVKNPVPRGLRNMLEVLMLFIRDEVARKAIPHGADRFVGYLLSTFFFILACNLLGLIPGMATATGNISVTAGLAIMAFIVIQVGGLREYGPIKHFQNLVPHGLPMWLVPVMFVLELLSMFIKPFALCIRLFANMMAGHIVILAFIFLIFILNQIWYVVAPFAVAFALFVYVLEILVAFLQAYIFTMLTAQFIGMSVHPTH